MSVSTQSISTGPAGGLVAGIAMIAAGVGLALHPALLHGNARLGDFAAVGLTMMGAFLTVYGTCELRRKRLR
ncbi:hypothetical protein ACVBGC_17165 [Burkholderia stagnalis]